MAELKQRNLDEVKALSRDEAVEIMRQAGIVGAGGGGFPTYFKWKNPQPNLIVNCTESEPGYWADKVLHREYFEELEELVEVLAVEHLVRPVARLRLGAVDDQARLRVLPLEVRREATTTCTHDAGLAHDLDGLILA